MKRSLIRFAKCILVVALLLQSSPCVFAHSSSQEGILAKSYLAQYDGYYIGGEDVGWSIDEGFHTNGTTITYSFSSTDPYLTSAYKSYVTTAANKWKNTVTITNKTDGSGTGLISTFHNPNTDIVAVFRNYSANSSGHLIAWQIQMNRAYTQTASILAHEFGHVIGLNDLYASKNSGKLMYGFTSGTASSPTSSDKWGAKVITGAHSSHSWGYKYHSTISTGNRHVKYCTGCNGLTDIIANCIYNSSNVCTICKIPLGEQPWSIRQEIK